MNSTIRMMDMSVITKYLAALLLTASVITISGIGAIQAQAQQAAADNDGAQTRDNKQSRTRKSKDEKGKKDKLPSRKEILKQYEPAMFNGMPYRLMKPIDYNPDTVYPLILSLHGKGGQGSDNFRSLKTWNSVLAQDPLRRKHPCFVLVPQSTTSWRVNGSEGLPTQEDIDALPAAWNKFKKRLINRQPVINGSLSLCFDLIDQLKTQYKIDDSRIYVLGHSMGGFGSWNAIWHRPNYFAAAIPCAGGLGPWKQYSKFKDVPTWAFHSADDPVVPVETSRSIFVALKKAGGNMKYTEFDGYGHGAQSPAFRYQGDEASGFTTQTASQQCDTTEDVWDWLFRQRKK